MPVLSILKLDNFYIVQGRGIQLSTERLRLKKEWGCCT